MIKLQTFADWPLRYSVEVDNPVSPVGGISPSGLVRVDLKDSISLESEGFCVRNP